MAVRKEREIKGQKGFGLVETVVALGILGIIGGAFLSGLATGSKSTDSYEKGVTAQALAQSQLEGIKAADYSNDYPKTVTEPPGYVLTIAVVETEVGQKQEITVTVTRGGDFVLKMSTVKTNPLPTPTP